MPSWSQFFGVTPAGDEFKQKTTVGLDQPSWESYGGPSYAMVGGKNIIPTSELPRPPMRMQGEVEEVSNPIEDLAILLFPGLSAGKVPNLLRSQVGAVGKDIGRSIAFSGKNTKKAIEKEIPDLVKSYKKTLTDIWSAQGEFHPLRGKSNLNPYESRKLHYDLIGRVKGLPDSNVKNKLFNELVNMDPRNLNTLDLEMGFQAYHKIKYREAADKAYNLRWKMGEEKANKLIAHIADSVEKGFNKKDTLGILESKFGSTAKGTGAGISDDLLATGKKVIKDERGSWSSEKFITRKDLKANPDNTFSSERTITVEVDGKFYNIPILIWGKQLDAGDAIKLFREGKTQAVGEADTLEEAISMAKERSNMLGREK